MFKGKIEDKQRVKTFIGSMDDRPIPLERIQDPDKPGHARPGPYTPDEFAACQHYGLLRPDGRQFVGLVTTNPDPTIPRRDEAPKGLLAAAAAAKVRLDSALAATAAERGRLERAQRQSGAGLVFLSRDESAILDNMTAVPRRELAEAEAAIAEWMRAETTRRSHSTPAALAHQAACEANQRAIEKVEREGRIVGTIRA